jgi:DNA-binding transcriptional ArsR family regulator
MNTNQVARIASLVGEPARTAMLVALMDGRALTAHELAATGNVTAATASRHLSLMVESGLLRVERQGRHRYHRLASREVAGVLEGIMQLAVRAAAPRTATGPRDASMRFARTCYDHLAGSLGVAVADHLSEEGAVVIAGDAAQVTTRAPGVLASLGIAPDALEAHGKRPACRACLDWSERRMHLAGTLGALLCAHCLDQGWLTRKRGVPRALEVTPAGAVALRNWLGHERWSALA